MGEPAGGDGGAKVLDGCGVAEEVVEGGGKDGWIVHVFKLPLRLTLSRSSSLGSTPSSCFDDTSSVRIGI